MYMVIWILPPIGWSMSWDELWGVPGILMVKPLLGGVKVFQLSLLPPAPNARAAVKGAVRQAMARKAGKLRICRHYIGQSRLIGSEIHNPEGSEIFGNRV